MTWLTVQLTAARLLNQIRNFGFRRLTKPRKLKLVEDTSVSTKSEP
jgi:hypothetical protein